MKCPACGYVSFDSPEKCKKCGGSLLSLEREWSQKEGAVVQEELFSSPREEEGPEESEGESPPELPESDEEYLPDREAPPAAPAEADGLPTEEVPLPAPPGETIPPADEESVIPEDLWVEEGAGFLPRLQALAVDLAILGGVLLLFLAAAVLVLSSDGYGWARLKTPEGIAALFLPFYLLGLFVSLSYFTFFLGWSGRTPGKALFNLDVLRTDGGEMTYTRGFLRGVGYLVSLTFVGLGFLWILFDERKRGWHDYLSGTWVKDLNDAG